MSDTFPITKKRRERNRRSGSEDPDDDFAEFFFEGRSTIDRRPKEIKITDASPGPNFLEILIFAVSVCLWLTFVIILCCHVIVAITNSSGYIYLIHQPRMMAFLVLQMTSIVVQFIAAICASFCISYDVEAHNVILMAKFAIGLVCANIVVFASILIVVMFGSHKANTQYFSDPRCKESCAHQVHRIIHLFVGCSYEGIALNLITIPVLIWVLKEAIVFVKLDYEARREKAIVKESPSSIDLRRKPESRRSTNTVRKVRFSQSTSSLIDSIIPELKMFKKLPDPPKRFANNTDNSDMRDAVIQVMSDEISSPVKNSSSPSGVNAQAEKKMPSRESVRRPQYSGSDTVSTVDPWSTTSSSSADSPEDF